MKRLILDTKIMVVCQSACGSAGITANVMPLGDVAKKHTKNIELLPVRNAQNKL